MCTKTAFSCALATTLLAGACGSVGEAGDASPADAAVVVDAEPARPDARLSDAAPGTCDREAAFTTFAAIDELNTDAAELNAWLSHDERTIFFVRAVPGQQHDIFFATRDDASGKFGDPEPLDELNTTGDEYKAMLTDDGLTIYFDRKPVGAGYSIMTATRPSLAADFVNDAPVSNVNLAGSSSFEPMVDSQGMYFGTTRDGDTELYFAPRAGNGFAAGESLLMVNSPDHNEELPVVSADGLSLYFVSTDRAAPPTGLDVWMAVRDDRKAPFGAPRILESLRTDQEEFPGWISDDDCRLYFASNRGPGGDRDLWLATRTPR